MTLQQIKAQIYNLGTYKQQKIEAYGTMKKRTLGKSSKSGFISV